MTIELRRRTWTVDEYQSMVAAGVLHPDDHVELIEGEVIEMATMGYRHILCTNKLCALLFPPAAGRVQVQVQVPIVLGDRSEPEPDLSIVRWRGRVTARQGPEDVLLAVEVADSSRRQDRRVKVPLYAHHAIPEVWVVDMDVEVVEVYDRPADGRYERVRPFGPGAVVPVPGLDPLVVDVTDLFA